MQAGMHTAIAGSGHSFNDPGCLDSSWPSGRRSGRDVRVSVEFHLCAYDSPTAINGLGSAACYRPCRV